MTAPWKPYQQDGANAFLRYFDAEMRYLREAGREFALDQPEAARRIGMLYGETDGPVRAVNEGFAMLMARLRMKLDDGLDAALPEPRAVLPYRAPLRRDGLGGMGNAGGVALGQVDPRRTRRRRSPAARPPRDRACTREQRTSAAPGSRQVLQRGYMLRVVCIHVDLDAGGFDGPGDAALFGDVLNHFLGRYASMQCSVQLMLTVDGKETRYPRSDFKGSPF
jgi:hypothetical protein